tara:strand:- start:133 stop:282 length:150 start_codon:yes stop_codon:yes gene_type:complete
MTIEERLEALEAMAHPKPTGKTQQRNEDRLDALEKAVGLDALKAVEELS